MAQISDVTVRIHADTRPLMRSLRRVRMHIWWYRFGALVMAAIGFALGLDVGLLINLGF